jgi:hypothetical protein
VVHAACPYQGTKYALSGKSPASTSVSWFPSTTSALSTPTTCLWLSHLTSAPYILVPCPTHPFHFFPVFFIDQQKFPFSGPHKLLFLSPTDLLSCQVRGQWFHSAPWWTNRNSGPLFHFLPASYIIQNFWPVNYLVCHLLSHCYLNWLMWPWKWRQYVPPDVADFQRTIQHYIPEDSTLMFIHFYMMWHIFVWHC